VKSLYSFIIKPFDSRYDNIKKIGDKHLILNTSIENHEFVSKKAVVVETPAAFNTKIKQGDIVYVHHNIFRRWYDQRGRERNSSTYFKDDLYFCNLGQVYAYKNKNKIISNWKYCFVSPIKETNALFNNKEQKHTGILKYSNSELEAIGLKPGELVTFTPNSEFEFIMEGDRLYCMKSNDIALTHEYEGNEKEYNPSWAQSS
jgi:hypothetical protein